MASAIKTAPKSSKLRKGILTLVTVGALGAVGAFASTAMLSDEVAISATAAHGGTLAINEITPGTFKITGVDNMVPYGVVGGIEGWQTSELHVKNNGSVPGKAKIDVTGTDGYGCYEYYIAEANPANGWGGIHGNQWTGRNPATATTVDVGTLAAGATKSYKFALRMKESCTQGSGLSSGGTAALESRNANHAQASLNVKLKIAQA